MVAAIRRDLVRIGAQIRYYEKLAGSYSDCLEESCKTYRISHGLSSRSPQADLEVHKQSASPRSASILAVLTSRRHSAGLKTPILQLRSPGGRAARAWRQKCNTIFQPLNNREQCAVTGCGDEGSRQRQRGRLASVRYLLPVPTAARERFQFL